MSRAIPANGLDRRAGRPRTAPVPFLIVDVPIPAHEAGVQIQLSQLRIVVEHLLEMRHQPFGIDGVAREAAAQLIVDTAGGHAIARVEHHADGLAVVEPFGVAQECLGLAGLRKFRGAAKAAVAGSYACLKSAPALRRISAVTPEPTAMNRSRPSAPDAHAIRRRSRRGRRGGSPRAAGSAEAVAGNRASPDGSPAENRSRRKRFRSGVRKTFNGQPPWPPWPEQTSCRFCPHPAAPRGPP